jgi:hypothetical protein
MAQLYRALKPGGVLLLTVPGLSPLNLAPDAWYWNFTPLAAQRLMEQSFGPGHFTIAVHGNVFAATCFLHGIAQQDLDLATLDPIDPCYPVIITVRAAKPL